MSCLTIRELGMEFLATPWLSGFVNGAYVTIGQTIRGINERAAPQWKINGGLRLLSDWGLSGEALVHYVGPTNNIPMASAFTNLAPLGAITPDDRVGSYTLLNLRGAYSFWGDKAEAAISVFNALNDRHREHPLGVRDQRDSAVHLTFLPLHHNEDPNPLA